VQWSLIGAHNLDNALAAIAAARHVGVEVPQALDALQAFQGVARRLQLRGEVNRIRVYDDFAHHPTAITNTIDGLRRRVGAARIIAVLEPRSHTMRMGVHRFTLAPALAARTRCGCTRHRIWAGTRARCWPRSARARTPAPTSTRWRAILRAARGPETTYSS